MAMMYNDFYGGDENPSTQEELNQIQDNEGDRNKKKMNLNQSMKNKGKKNNSPNNNNQTVNINKKNVGNNIQSNVDKNQLENEMDPPGWTFDTLEDEIEYLRKENFKLRQKLSPNSYGSNALRWKNNNTKILPDEFSKRVQEKLPDMLKRAEEQSRKAKNNKSQINDNEMKQNDWWTMVDARSIQENNILASLNDNNNNIQDQLVFNETSALDGPFVFIRESDVIESVAFFVAQCVLRMPECQNLGHEDMMKLLDGTFAELREKGPLGKMWEWGQFFYTIYGWSSSVWGVYTNPAVARTIVIALWKVGRYLIF